MADITGTFLPDILIGTAGDDTISGLGGLDILSGGNGNDRIDGGTGDDILNGDDGDDILYGGAGIASILSFYNGGNGNDLMIGSPDGIEENFNGGDGIDTVSFEMRNRGVDVRLDIQGLPLLDSIVNVENVIGSRFADSITGNADRNTLSGGLGNDTLNGGAGDDMLSGGLGADTLIGGAGIDTAFYNDVLGAVFVNLTLGRGYGNAAEGDTLTGIENVIGSKGNDTLIGDGLANRLEGDAGDDVLRGAFGADQLIGGEGIDTASYEDNQGSVFVDLLRGVGFNNSAQGDTFDSIENLTGSIYGDVFIGTAGANRLDGMDGDDLLLGGLGADVLIGGLGSDTASYEDNQGAVIVNLLTGRGFGNAAEGDTYDSIENVVGTVFYDTLIGDNSANRLNGGRGADTLTGNGGADQFVFDTPVDGVSNIDTIVDFTSGEDKIVLDGAIFDLPDGALGPNSLVFGTQATGGGNRLVYDQSTGNLWFDSDGFGTDPAMLFAVLESKPTIVASDFMVI